MTDPSSEPAPTLSEPMLDPEPISQSGEPAGTAPLPAEAPTPRPTSGPRPLHRHSLAHRLFEESYEFDFFQAVRLLQRMEPGRVQVGRGGPPHAEAVRFRGGSR